MRQPLQFAQEQKNNTRTTLPPFPDLCWLNFAFGTHKFSPISPCRTYRPSLWSSAVELSRWSSE